MAYATQADIEGELQGVKFPESPVTVEVLTGILNQESSEIDQHIGNLYVLPITDASALLYLKKLCIALVVFRVVTILGTKNPQGNDRDISRETAAYNNARRSLKMIEDGDKNLVGADRNTSQSKIISGTPAANASCRVFKKDEDQW